MVERAPGAPAPSTNPAVEEQLAPSPRTDPAGAVVGVGHQGGGSALVREGARRRGRDPSRRDRCSSTVSEVTERRDVGPTSGRPRRGGGVQYRHLRPRAGPGPRHVPSGPREPPGRAPPNPGRILVHLAEAQDLERSRRCTVSRRSPSVARRCFPGLDLTRRAGRRRPVRATAGRRPAARRAGLRCSPPTATFLALYRPDGDDAVPEAVFVG